MDIDLNIATSYGSISLENTSSSSLLVNISNGRTLREVIRKRELLEGILQSQFGQLVVSSLDTKISLNGKMILLFDGEDIAEAKRLYLGWQLLLSKLGL
ncbi:MAG: hypothetical protein ACQEST_07905 [Bacteroidota bacterium]